MNGDVSIDVGAAIEYSTNKILEVFGKDSLSLSLKMSLKKRIQVSIQESSYVQIIGMPNPIPIYEIFQSLNFSSNQYYKQQSKYNTNLKIIELSEFLELDLDGIIFGGPGSGKTTVLNQIFLSKIHQKRKISLMFRLRKPEEVNELYNLVEFTLNSKVIKKNQKITLFIDGYDEINLELRKEVSKILNSFKASNKGTFIMTCRLHYSIIDLNVQHFFLQDFSNEQAIKFVKIYLEKYQVDYNPRKLINELIERGFKDFLNNPLMLNLVCVLKTGPLPFLPKNSIGLIERAIRTLTYRWDDSRGIARDSNLLIDGIDRIKILKCIAYYFDSPIGGIGTAVRETEILLKKLHHSHINPIQLLEEISQWYGIFIPVGDYKWAFTHRSLHDYLAAQYWVESGMFNPSTNHIFNTRSAYAACLIPDATDFLISAFKKDVEPYVIIECLKNNVPFDSSEVAKSLLNYYKEHYSLYSLDIDNKNKKIRISVETNFFHLITDDFLLSIITIGSLSKEKENTLLYILGVLESEKRKAELKYDERIDLRGYEFSFLTS